MIPAASNLAWKSFPKLRAKLRFVRNFGGILNLEEFDETA